MLWKDEGIILHIDRFGERSLRVSILTKDHGKWSGIIKSPSSKDKNLIQIGVHTSAQWQARLEDHLGFWKFDDLKQAWGDLFHHRGALYILSSACHILYASLPERHPYPTIYSMLVNLLNNVCDDQMNILSYINFEINLLRESGFALQLGRCGETQTTENLSYISPKTGRAICYDVGKPYEDKLLKMPRFFLNNQEFFRPSDLEQALNVTGYFIKKHLLKPNQNLPYMRSLIVNNKTQSFKQL